MQKLVVLASAALLLGLPHADSADPPGAAKELQGRWMTKSVQFDDPVLNNRESTKPSLTIDGDKLVLDDGELKWNGFIKLPKGGGKGPKLIDLHYGDKADKKNWYERVGVYEVKGDELWICYSTVVPVMEAQRPKDFTTPPRSGRVLHIYERVKN